MTMMPSDSGNTPRAPAPPVCPQCKSVMRIRTVEPLMFAHDVDHMTYRCEACGTESKRAVKRA
jgi:hypothetical protein